MLNLPLVSQDMQASFTSSLLALLRHLARQFGGEDLVLQPRLSSSPPSGMNQHQHDASRSRDDVMASVDGDQVELVLVTVFIASLSLVFDDSLFAAKKHSHMSSNSSLY
jgi:hypothetical protein